MPVVLVNESEKIRFQYSGSVFILRRASSGKKQAIRNRNTSKTRRGEVIDNDAVANELLEYCVIGWENVVDHKGKEVKFNSELLESLPDDTKIAIIERLDDSEIQTEKRAKEELGE